MNRVLPLLIVLCVPLLSGCATFGYPPDAVKPGAAVSFKFAAAPDLECFVGPPFGSAPSALVQGSLGLRAGGSFQATVPAGTPCNPVIGYPKEFSRVERFIPIPRATFVSDFGAEPEAGKEYSIATRQGMQAFRVERENATTVTLERAFSAWRQSYPEFGLDLVIHVTDTEVVRSLEANVSAAPFAGATIGLPAGNYTVVGERGDQVLYARQEARAVGPLEATATVVHVGPREDVPDSPGFGARRPLEAALPPSAH